MNGLRSFVMAVGRRLRTLFRHPRYQVVAVVVTVSFILGDSLFPFSSFPMYGDFPDRTFYVYLADSRGEALPLHDLFGYRTTFLKRIYNRKVGAVVRDLESKGEEAELHLLTSPQLRPAGDGTLQWLVENDKRRKKKSGVVPALQLIQVDVEEVDGRLVRRPRVVGVYPGGAP